MKHVEGIRGMKSVLQGSMRACLLTLIVAFGPSSAEEASATECEPNTEWCECTGPCGGPGSGKVWVGDFYCDAEGRQHTAGDWECVSTCPEECGL